MVPESGFEECCCTSTEDKVVERSDIVAVICSKTFLNDPLA
jgi:hypothetical protein